ncbi:MAG: Gfo/Idh/MocA family protein [Candidatus Heimdallarchaeaceae archaeon]
MEKLNVVVIGVGSWGQNHARVFSEIENTNLIGLYDLNQDRAKQLALKYGVQVFPNLESVYKNDDVDIITIASPTTTHAKIAEKAIEHGKNVLIEKPMTSTVEEAEKIVQMEKDYDVIVSVGFIERFNPIVERSKTLIEDKELGDIVLLSARRLGPYWPDRLKDVDVIRDVSIHDIDVFRYLLGKDPLSVYARGGKLRHGYFDYAEILLDFNEGITGFIESNYLTPHKHRKLMLTCEHGIVEADYMTQEYVIEDDESVRKPKYSWKEPLKAEMKEFVNACLTKTKPPVTALDGLKALKIAISSIESINAHRVVELDF